MAEVEQSRMDIGAGSLFPWHFQLLALLMAVGGFVLLGTNLAVSGLLFILSATMLTARAGFEINPGEKKYREYNSFLFLKTGEWENFQAPESIFINTTKVSQKVYGPRTTQSSTFSNIQFNGYLKFDSGKKVHILTLAKKEALLEKLKKLSEYLKVDIVDYT